MTSRIRHRQKLFIVATILCLMSLSTACRRDPAPATPQSTSEPAKLVATQTLPAPEKEESGASTASSEADSPYSTIAEVTVGEIFVREGAGRTYDALATVTNGQEMSVIGQDGACRWLQVRLADGLVGWVPSLAVVLDAPCERLATVDFDQDDQQSPKTPTIAPSPTLTPTVEPSATPTPVPKPTAPVAQRRHTEVGIPRPEPTINGGVLDPVEFEIKGFPLSPDHFGSDESADSEGWEVEQNPDSEP